MPGSTTAGLGFTRMAVSDFIDKGGLEDNQKPVKNSQELVINQIKTLKIEIGGQ